MAINFNSNANNVLSALTQAQVNALRRIGMMGEAESKLLCPVESGTLKRSITNVVDEGDKSVSIGTNVDYSVYVHEGTSRQQAQPFIKDGVMNNIDRIINIARENLRREMGE